MTAAAELHRIMGRLARHDGRVTIVTGASSGLGRGIATRFAQEGSAVVVADLQREPKAVEKFEQESELPTDEYIESALEGEATFIETDVTRPDEVMALIRKTVDEYGRLDVLVNNAGIYIPGDSQSMTVEEWQQVIDVNLNAPFYTSKFAATHLERSEGCIVNIASVHATEGGSGPAYSSSKAGVLNLTRDLAVEFGPDIRVNAILPSFSKTSILNFADEEYLADALDHIPMNRFGDPADIGDAAVFLASEEASFIQGAALPVDGGWSTHRN